MKTAALVAFLALCVLAKEEEKATQAKPDVTKRGLLHSHSSGVELSEGIGSGSNHGVLATGGSTVGVELNGGSIFGSGVPGDSVVVIDGVFDGSSIGSGASVGQIIGGHPPCSHGVIHGGSQHISLGNTFLHHQAVPSTPVVRTLRVERPVPVPVPQPFHVHVDRPVPVPHDVPEPYNVNVPKPYAVPIEKAVKYEVIKHVPVQVERRIPYTVKKLVPYPVERRIPYPVHVPVDRAYHVQVPKPYPVVLTRRVPYIVDKQVSHPVNVNVEVPVPHPVPYDVPRPYTVKVPHPVPVHIDRPYAVHVPKPVPVHVTQHVSVPVPHPVPVSVVKPVPVPVHESVHVPTPVSHSEILPTQFISGPHLGSSVHTDKSSLLLSHGSTLGSDIVLDQGSLINHPPLTTGEFKPFATAQTFVQGITPTVLPHVLSTPVAVIGGAGIQKTFISNGSPITVNGVRYSGNGFSFGTKLGSSQSSLFSSDIGAHGSFDLAHRDTHHFFPTSSVKPDLAFDLNSQHGSDSNGFNVPLTVKVSRSSEESENKSETSKPSTPKVEKNKSE